MTGPDRQPAAVLAARDVLSLHQMQFAAHSADAVRIPGEASTDLARRLAVTVAHNIRQIVPFIRRRWSTDALDHLIGRNLAEAGRSVQRLYLLPHRNITPELVAAQVRADEASGVDARCLAVSRIPADIPAGQALKNSWILDDEAIAFEETLPDRPAHWYVSSDPAEVTAHLNHWSQLWAEAARQVAAPSFLQLDEPLAMTADLTALVARESCTSSYVDSGTCAWYHGVWQYLRLLDVVSTPSWHEAFYDTSFKQVLGDTPAGRVLISGCADYSLLAHLIHSARVARSTPEVTVLDVCPTPLLSCQWYARRSGSPIGVEQSDIIGYGATSTDRYDVITSDAFLTRFDRRTAVEVLRAWHRLLDTGGVVVTTVRNHQASRAGRPVDGSAVQAFVDRCTRRAHVWQWFLEADPVVIRDLASRYAERITSHELGDDTEITALFRAAGFRILRAESAEVPGEFASTTYLRILARKEDP